MWKECGKKKELKKRKKKVIKVSKRENKAIFILNYSQKKEKDSDTRRKLTVLILEEKISLMAEISDIFCG
ncbi:MAG: hypothetical protein QG610_2009 [Euryarchaeota archaeon]|nr:hypothetical protein [Euryarchaeota archaeon]